MDNFYEQKKAVANIMKRLFDRKLTTVSGGNISLRLTDTLFCITPSGLDKSCLTPECIAIVDINGKNYTPEFKLSIESELHRKILINRPDINAIVHSHPIYCSAFSGITGVSPIMSDMTAESYFFLGEIINVPYALMGTKELADLVSENAKKHDVMLMQNHGAIALAPTLLGAFDKIDLLERAAEMTVAVKSLERNGIKANPLTKSQCEELDSLK